MSEPRTETTATRASTGQAARAVLWSFIGIRRSDRYADDVARITPVQAIVTGLVAAAVFVGVLVTLVRYLTSQ